MSDLKTARRSGSTVMGLGVLDVPVALYKATTDGGKEARWETRLVDADGKPLTPPAASITAEALTGAPVQGDPLGDDNEAASEALDAAQDASRAWNPPEPESPPEPEVKRERGFETEGGFVPADAELDAIAVATQLEVMNVVGFVRAEQIDRARVIGGYFIGPEGDTTERALALKALDMLRRATQRSSRFPVVKWTKKTKQGLGVIAPHRSGALVLLELAWGENVRKPPKTCVLPGNLASEREVDACCQLIEAMAEPRASLDEMRDDAVVLRQKARALAEEGKLEEFSTGEARPRMDIGAHDLDEAMAESVEVADDLVAAA